MLSSLSVTPLRDGDREDIDILARDKLIDAGSLRKRAGEALKGSVGDLAPVRTSIDLARTLVASVQRAKVGR